MDKPGANMRDCDLRTGNCTPETGNKVKEIGPLSDLISFGHYGPNFLRHNSRLETEYK